MRARIASAPAAGVAGLAALLCCLLAAAPAAAAPGDLDPSFGSHGIAPLAGCDCRLDVALDDTGRAVTAAQPYEEPGLELRRYETDGSLDTGFGANGSRVVGSDTFGPAEVAIQPDGRILVAANDYADGDSDWLIHVFRLTAGGNLDDTFGGGDGEVELEPGAGEPNRPGELLATPSGRILVTAGAGNDAVVIGLQEDGSLDAGFGDAGVRVLDAGDGAEADAIESAGGGNYIVAATTYLSGPTKVFRIDGSGNVDAGFGDDGVQTVRGSSEPVSLSVGPDGRIAVGGTGYGFFDLYYVSVDTQVSVLQPDGDVDPAFDTLPVRTLFDAGDQTISGLSWDAAGHLLVAGSQWFQARGPGAHSDAYIARFDAHGRPDPSFGRTNFISGGIAQFPMDFSTFPAGSIGEPQLLPDGRAVALAGPNLVRFLNGGPSDGDADGVPNGSDGCPYRYSAKADGCQRARLDIKLRYRKGTFSGRVSGPRVCRFKDPDGPTARKVKLYRRKKGRDRVVGRAYASGKFTIERKARGHRYYAKLPRRYVRDTVVCLRAKSAVVPKRERR